MDCKSIILLSQFSQSAYGTKNCNQRQNQSLMGKNEGMDTFINGFSLGIHSYSVYFRIWKRGVS